MKRAKKSEIDYRLLMLHGYTHLDSLASGKLESDGMWVLFELIQFGDYLAQRIASTLERDDPAAVPMARYVMQTAAECLSETAQRYKASKKFEASEHEITVIRNAISFIDQMIDIAKPVQAAKAMIEAGKTVIAATSSQSAIKVALA